MDAKKPYMLAITTVAIYTGMYVVSKAAFNQGMNSFVFVFYRQAAASLLLLPIALVLERKNVRSMSSGLILKLFLLALIWNTLGMNLCNASVTLTSATVASATGNSTPVITFCLALLLRMEVVKLRSVSGIAKVTGVALCLAGALVIALYTGPSLSPVNRHHRASGGAHGFKAPTRGGTWVTGTFLMLLSNVTWSLWTVLQGALLKEYPNKLLVTTSQCLFSTAQSFVVAAVAERDFSKWALKLDVSLIAVAYTIKGPVFLAVWNPLCFVLTIFCSSFFLGENVHLGSIVGGILLVCGLYSVLWGKTLEVHQTVESGDNTVGEVQNGQEEKNHQQKVLEKGRQEEASMTAPGVV
ncbi:WAT1-related protein At5g64700 isoform X2 [Zea mays]|uniref:WAT1-related protein At5g64700 isoform X2 n=1 Tax=Zea mays TaxID=4577 RepID=UPI0004DEA973|nr:WAT1-related protein At5g64700 isoform X2 [Zea mays]|eukprot:XP_008660050.1 WAT1-related protein At5g64700 isoform X2 [Zea mays]